MLKKGNWQEREPVTDECHDRPEKPDEKRDYELKRGPTGRRSSNARQMGCEICQRTKITRAPCRRRIGGAVPRSENFGDLFTADHKVLSEKW